MVGLIPFTREVSGIDHLKRGKPQLTYNEKGQGGGGLNSKEVLWIPRVKEDGGKKADGGSKENEKEKATTS